MMKQQNNPIHFQIPGYRQYERKKLGYRPNIIAGLGYMIRQSFLAGNFSRFWQNWNPLFSYYLLYYCYRPLLKYLPRFITIITVFAISGAIHDLAASVIKQQAFVLFTPLFAFYGLLVVFENYFWPDDYSLPVFIRPLYHLFLIIGPYFLVARFVA